MAKKKSDKNIDKLLSDALIKKEDQPYSIPDNWAWIKIGSICDAINGRAFKSEDWKKSGFPIIRIQNLKDPSAKYNYFRGEFDNKHLVKKNDLLFAWSGTPGTSFGAHIWKNENSILNQHIFNLSFNRKHMNYEYFHFLLNARIDYFIDQAQGGVGLAHITKTKFINSIVPLAPYPEQKRIVTKLSAMLEKLKQAKALIREAKETFETRRAAILHKAFTGELTKKWREANKEKRVDKFTASTVKPHSIPETWDFIQLKSCINKIQAGKNFKCPSIPVAEDSVGLVKISAVTWGRFDPKETKTIIDKGKIIPELFIKKDDFLISRANTLELVGASVIVDKINHKIMLSDKIWRVTFNGVNKRYVNYYLKSLFGRKEIESRATGSQLSMRNISQKSFKEINLPNTSIKEQNEIVQRLESFFFSEDKALNLIGLEKQIDQIEKSILAKAFKGELDSNNPDDEPANDLLKRILQEKQKEKMAITKKLPSRGITIKAKPIKIGITSNKATITVMKDEKRSILEILKKSNAAIPAKEVWQNSKHFDNIEGFYAELKSIEDQLIEIKEGKISKLRLKK